MIINYIWVSLFFISTFTLIYLVILKYFYRESIRKNFLITELKDEIIPTQKHFFNFSILSLKNRLLRYVPKENLKRQNIKHALPAFIDYLTIAVEAGLGLDMAITRIISKIHGPLAEEMANAMIEIKYGK